MNIGRQQICRPIFKCAVIKLGLWGTRIVVPQWASYQIHKIAGCACAVNAGMPGAFSPPSRVSDPDMHHGTSVMHMPWCMPGSLTNGFLWCRWWGKRSSQSRRMRNRQFYVSGKKPMAARWYLTDISTALLSSCLSLFEAIQSGEICVVFEILPIGNYEIAYYSRRPRSRDHVSRDHISPQMNPQQLKKKTSFMSTAELVMYSKCFVHTFHTHLSIVCMIVTEAMNWNPNHCIETAIREFEWNHM